MSLLAQERLPQPHGITAAVSADIAARTLTVRISDFASSYQRQQWKEAWRALKSSEESGRPATLWANAKGAYHCAFATLADAAFSGQLAFRFRPGEQAFSQLVGRPGLTAIVWVDRETHRFINVDFKHAS